MTKYLVIVESPAKCAKIQEYLGKNYIVKDGDIIHFLFNV